MVDEVGSAAVYEVLRPIGLAGKHATVTVAGDSDHGGTGVGADLGVPRRGLADGDGAAPAAETCGRP